MRKTPFIEEHISHALQQAEHVTSVKEVIRKTGIIELEARAAVLESTIKKQQYAAK